MITPIKKERYLKKVATLQFSTHLDYYVQPSLAKPSLLFIVRRVLLVYYTNLILNFKTSEKKQQFSFTLPLPTDPSPVPNPVGYYDNYYLQSIRFFVHHM